MINFVKIGRTAVEIWPFLDCSRWRPPPSWIFEISKVLTVVTVKSVELRHRVKFRRNRSKRGRDIAIYRFFKMAAAAILDFENFKFLTVGAV